MDVRVRVSIQNHVLDARSKITAGNPAMLRQGSTYWRVKGLVNKSVYMSIFVIAA
jgi:hypothetical protein